MRRLICDIGTSKSLGKSCSGWAITTGHSSAVGLTGLLLAAVGVPFEKNYGWLPRSVLIVGRVEVVYARIGAGFYTGCSVCIYVNTLKWLSNLLYHKSGFRFTSIVSVVTHDVSLQKQWRQNADLQLIFLCLR